MTEPKWKKFEKHIHQIHAQLAPVGAKLAYDDKIMGFDSKTERQIEITIRYKLANYEILLIIDCKDYAQPIDVVDMGAFKSLAIDVRANKAVMITTNGYTPSAIEMARSAGIETRTYLNTGSSDWPSVVSIPPTVRIRVGLSHSCLVRNRRSIVILRPGRAGRLSLRVAAF